MTAVLRPGRRRTSKWDAVAEIVKANRGRWVPVGDYHRADVVNALELRGLFSVERIDGVVHALYEGEVAACQ